MARTAAANRVASTRNNSILYNGNFEIKPAVITAATTTAARWIDGTAAGSQAKTGLGWSALTVTASAEIGFDTTIFRSGTASMRLSTLNAAGAVTAGSYRINAPVASSLFELIPLVANQVYTLSAYIRTNNVATNGAFIEFREFNATGGTVLTTTSTKLSGTDTTWRNVSFTLTTNALTRFGGIFLRNNVTGNVSDAWFDDITLTPSIDVATSFYTRTAMASSPGGGLNLVANPSFEVDTASWGGTGSGSTLTRDTSQFLYGTASGRMNTSADGQWVSCFPPEMEKSTEYTFSCYVKGTLGETIHLNIYTGAADIPGSAIVLTGGWQRLTTTQTTAATGQAEMQIRRDAGDTTNPVWIDGVMIQKGSTLTDYFDGSFGTGYAWRGTANNSISTRNSRTNQ